MADGAPGGRERRWWRLAVAVSAPGGRERRWWQSHSRRPWFAKEKLAVGGGSRRLAKEMVAFAGGGRRWLALGAFTVVGPWCPWSRSRILDDLGEIAVYLGEIAGVGA
nr:hypothetical protein Iba_scaffold5973CG0020 [Ipomoea batatas]